MWRTIVIIGFLAVNSLCESPEEAHGVKWADKCEVCKVVAVELEARLNETGKTSEVLEMGYSVDDIAPRKKREYKISELRLVETLESVCERIMNYNIHKERKDSTRFAKGMSETFRTLHDLADKGVKVDLGFDEELWDKPSVEIHDLKKQCDVLLETYESDIEDWYFNREDKPLTTYLCSERALKDMDDSCLKEKGDKGPRESKKKEIKESKESEESEESADHSKDEL